MLENQLTPDDLLTKALAEVRRTMKHTWSAYALLEQLEVGNGLTGPDAHRVAEILCQAQRHANEFGRIIAEYNIASQRKEPPCAPSTSLPAEAPPKPPADEG